MDYTERDDLIFSKKVENRQTDELPAEIHVLVPPEESGDEKEAVDDGEDEIDQTNKELEAKYVARRIKALLRDGKKADGSPILPHDIAVLFRARSMGSIVKEALEKAGN